LKAWPLTILSFLFTIAAHASPGGKVCPRNQTRHTDIQISRELIVHLEVNSCDINENRGTVETTARIGKKTQRFTFHYTASAYSINIDSSIDLDGDGIRDLGISNGEGRSGNGMSYWIFDITSKSYIYAGKSPTLQRESIDRRRLFSAESSSGEMQAIRYNYIIKNKKLEMTGAIGFIPNDDIYEVSLMKCSRNGLCKEKKRIKNIFPARAQGCMNGTASCDFSIRKEPLAY